MDNNTSEAMSISASVRTERAHAPDLHNLHDDVLDDSAELVSHVVVAKHNACRCSQLIALLRAGCYIEGEHPGDAYVRGWNASRRDLLRALGAEDVQ